MPININALKSQLLAAADEIETEDAKMAEALREAATVIEDAQK